MDILLDPLKFPVGSTTFLVGLSGGADSMALLHILVNQGYDCVAAHCNFHLRGDESNRDQAAAASLASKMGVRFMVKDFDIPARQRLTGESVEMACREARYSWWNELISSGTADYIAVAHHADDNIETFFINLLRGSGLRGLKAMLPVNGLIVRPLLNMYRDEIVEYCHDHGLEYVIDSTNLQNDFIRNKIRNLVIPYITRIFPGAKNGINNSISYLQEDLVLQNKLVTESLTYLENGKDAISLPFEASDGEIYELLRSRGFNHSQAHDVRNSLGKSGRLFATPKGRFLLNRGQIIKLGENTTPRSLKSQDINDLPLKIKIHDIGEFTPVKGDKKLCIFLDSKSLEGNPEWTWRRWQNGDRFRPFGMKGTRLVSDLLSDAHLSLQQKQNVRILCRNNQILWVWPLRASAHFRVTQSSTKFIEIQVDAGA